MSLFWSSTRLVNLPATLNTLTGVNNQQYSAVNNSWRIVLSDTWRPSCLSQRNVYVKAMALASWHPEGFYVSFHQAKKCPLSPAKIRVTISGRRSFINSNHGWFKLVLHFKLSQKPCCVVGMTVFFKKARAMLFFKWSRIIWRCNSAVFCVFTVRFFSFLIHLLTQRHSLV